MLDLFREWMQEHALGWPDHCSRKEPRLNVVCAEGSFPSLSTSLSAVGTDGEESQDKGMNVGKRMAPVVPSSPVAMRTTWTCDICLYAGNGPTSPKCVACGEKGKPWTCSTCGKVNKVNVLLCNLCAGSPQKDFGTEIIEVAAEASLPSYIEISEPTQDPGVLFDGGMTSKITFQGKKRWIEFAIPNDSVLESLEIFLESYHNITQLDVVAAPIDVSVRKGICCKQGCNIIASRNSDRKGFCCSLCEIGDGHSADCTSSCRKQCTSVHYDNCRLCLQPPSLHTGPTKHTCENGKRGAFSYNNNNRISRVLLLRPRKDARSIPISPATFGWISVLSRESCLEENVKSVYISCISPDENASYMSGIRFTTKSLTRTEIDLPWRCVACYGLNDVKNRQNCTHCGVHFSLTSIGEFSTPSFLNDLSLSRKTLIRARVACMALKQNILYVERNLSAGPKHKQHVTRGDAGITIYDSLSDEGSADEQDTDTDEDDLNNTEITLNDIIAKYVDVGDIPIPEAISATSESLRMQSVMFWSTSTLCSFDNLQQFIAARDNDHNTGAHLAAYCGLRRTFTTLCGNGATKWSANKKGQTPMGLMCGLRDEEPNVFTLHKLCSLGNIFSSTQDSICPATRCLLRCSPDVDVEGPFVDILKDILTGYPEEALETLTSYTDESTHFRVYKALATLLAGYGLKSCATYLRTYVENITALSLTGDGEKVCLSPLYFYVRYAMWTHMHGPEASSKV